MKKVGIIGCGWLGLRIARHLFPKYKILATTTSEANKAYLQTMGYEAVAIQFSDQEISQETNLFETANGLDAVIITVPFPKSTDTEFLINRFGNICLFIREFAKQLFLMSSIGIYPQIENEIGENTVAEQLLDPNMLLIEKLVQSNFPQVNILRLGGLMGDDRVFSKYKPQNLGQVVNHVHFEDVCLIIERMISKNCSSRIYNVVAPLHPTKLGVINYQKGILDTVNSPENPDGRIILSNLLMRELEYEFKHPDPRSFF